MSSPLKDKQTALYRQLARMGEAFSNPYRLKIISLLSQGPKTVDQLAGLVGHSKATTSAHLKVLENSGLLLKSKQGRYVWCRLASESTARLWLELRALGEELLPENREIVQAHFADPESLSEFSPESLLPRLESGDFTLIDLRPLDEYEAGHLPRAHHLPYATLADNLPQLSQEPPLLIYCRGPYCLQALEGTQTIRASGLSAKRLRFGAPEWSAAGLPLEN